MYVVTVFYYVHPFLVCQFQQSVEFYFLAIQPENILCVNTTGNQIKIIDFGLARK